MKRGIMTETLGVVIVSIAVTVILLAFVNTLVGGLRKESPIQACKLSVATAAAAKKTTGNLVDLGVSCPRQNIEFKEEDTLGVSERIAKEMYLCAERFSHGSVDFTPLTWLIPKEGGSCLVCAVFNIKDPQLIKDYREKPRRILDDLPRVYFASLDMSAKAYFDSVNTKAEAHQQNLRYVVDPNYDPRETGYIFFVNVQQKSFLGHWETKFQVIQDLREWWQGGGDPYPNNFVLFTNADVAYDSKLCGKLLN